MFSFSCEKKMKFSFADGQTTVREWISACHVKHNDTQRQHHTTHLQNTITELNNNKLKLNVYMRKLFEMKAEIISLARLTVGT